MFFPSYLGPPLIALALSQDRQLHTGTTDSQFHHEQLIQGEDGWDAPGESSESPLKASINQTIPGGYTSYPVEMGSARIGSHQLSVRRRIRADENM